MPFKLLCTLFFLISLHCADASAGCFPWPPFCTPGRPPNGDPIPPARGYAARVTSAPIALVMSPDGTEKTVRGLTPANRQTITRGNPTYAGYPTNLYYAYNLTATCVGECEGRPPVLNIDLRAWSRWYNVTPARRGLEITFYSKGQPLETILLRDTRSRECGRMSHKTWVFEDDPDTARRETIRNETFTSMDAVSLTAYGDTYQLCKCGAPPRGCTREPRI